MQNRPVMEAFVMDLLKSKLPVQYYYHNYEHTLYVMEKAVEIARQENCTEAEIELIRAAALWHDTGFINRYSGHEEESCILVQQYLPGYEYSINDIDEICGIIMATKIPQSPKNKLEEIVADADLEYLGTGWAGTKANDLFMELQYLDPSLTRAEWDQTQISFLQKHHYFTRFCKENREPLKQAYLNKLLEGMA
jgi:uncharacterized protein